MVCPICNLNKVIAFKKQKIGYDRKPYKIFECLNCGLRFIDSNIVDSKIYEEVYQGDSPYGSYKEYYSFLKNIKSSSNPLSFLAGENPEYLAVKDFLYSNDGIKNILDFGCGLGYMTYALNHEGYNCTGVDLSKTAISAAKKNFGEKNFYCGDINKLSINKKFDLIICLELIEHVSNPDGLIKNLKKFLTNEGKILITTPLIEDQYPYYSKYYISGIIPWFTDLPPIHYYFFSINSLRMLANNNQLNPILKNVNVNKNVFSINSLLYKLTDSLESKKTSLIGKYLHKLSKLTFEFSMDLLTNKIVNNTINKILIYLNISKFRYFIFEK